MSPRRPAVDPEYVAADIHQRFARCIPGTRLPGRTELARYYGCSEHIAAKSIDQLVRDGLVQRRNRGAFIVSRAVPAEIERVCALVTLKKTMLFQQTVLAGVSERCQTFGLKVDVHYSPPPPIGVDVLRKLAGGDPLTVGWVVLLDELPPLRTIREWQRHGVPFVVVDDYSDIAGVNLVVRDIQRAVFHATEKLILAGHRRIVCAAIPTPLSDVGRQRIQGFRSAHEHHRVPFDDRRIIMLTAECSRLDVVLRSMLSGSARPTGIVSMDQGFGCESIRMCDGLGLRVPQDVSVISAGLRRRLEPPELPRLSCMDEGTPQRMGHMAVDLLVKHRDMNGPATIWLQPGYVDRGSVGPPPGSP
ncbi:MAG: substrate-binding domain-containing protein [Phycisphaerae bacterium]|nr:substrate-binding domain-containing protein [Phycisphaerae bacterium]